MGYYAHFKKGLKYMAYSYFDDHSLEDLYNEMEAVYLNDNRPWIIGYSGGKDSTVCVELTFRMLMRLPIEQRQKTVYIVSSDTLIENPIILEFLNSNIWDGKNFMQIQRDVTWKE